MYNTLENKLNINKSQIDYKNLVPKKNGFVFKFIKKENNFIHTFIEGDFLEKVGLDPLFVVGKALDQFLPKLQAAKKHAFYELAWEGTIVNYEGELNGFYYLASLTPVIIDSQIVEVNGTAIEITEHRKNNEKIQELEKLSLIGELAAGIAHEIRNPLTSIIGFAQMIKENSDDGLTNNYLQIMLNELNRISSIVNEFMFIAKPKENMKIINTDIKKLIYHVIEFMQPQSRLKGVDVLVLMDSDFPITACCDPNQLTQVLINLIQNALEATTDTRGNITVSLQDINEKNFLIEIADKGAGISKDRQKKLFEPFYTTKEKGTGLGLMTCKRIVENHNGTIKLSSHPEEGTIVTIILPKVQNSFSR